MNHQCKIMQDFHPAISMLTDMSSHPEHEVAGWGGWISNGHQIMTGSGPLPWSVNSEELEVLAMNRMLKHSLMNGFIDNQNMSIIVQSDNVVALRALTILPGVQVLKPEHVMDDRIVPLKTVPKWMKSSLKECVTEFATLYERFNEIYVQHVRGHRPKTISGRHRINIECDRLAKRAMRAQLPGQEPDILLEFQQDDKSVLPEDMDAGL